MVFHSWAHCQDHSCRLSPWASQSASSESCLASQDCDSECSLRPEWVVAVQVPFSADPVQYRPVRPTVNLSLLSRNPASCGRESSNCRTVRENTRPPGVRTMCSSDKSLLPTQNTLDEHCIALVPTFSSLQTTMWLCNPDKNDFREKDDLMSVMLTIGLFVRRHSVALRFVST